MPIDPVKDPTDWDEVYRHFTPEQVPGVKKLNNPTITDKVNPAKLKASWGEIRRLIYEILPEPDALVDLMKRAGCAITPEEVHVSPELLAEGLRWHSYMRYRVLITRLLPMIGVDPMDYID